MVLLTRALLGNYVNFGVFALYGDPALVNALQMVLQLVLSIPFPEMIVPFPLLCSTQRKNSSRAQAYPKVVRAYYYFINTLAQTHTSALLELDPTTFMQIISSLKEGLNSLTTVASVSSQSCDAFGVLIIIPTLGGPSRPHLPFLLRRPHFHIRGGEQNKGYPCYEIFWCRHISPC